MFRVILLDQRGTGSSSPITVTNLKNKGTPEEQAHYLSFFRQGGRERRGEGRGGQGCRCDDDCLLDAVSDALDCLSGQIASSETVKWCARRLFPRKAMGGGEEGNPGDATLMLCGSCRNITTSLALSRWSIMGQSFGGFCATTYLSLAPNSEILHACPLLSVFIRASQAA